MMESLYTTFLQSKGVSIDSRESMEGKIFFALKGERFDGNTFALAAISQGALLSVVDDPTITHDKCLPVEDVLTVMQALATHHRRQFDIPVIAITGSNGKTTTKELMVAVLKEKYKVHATAGNFNNHIGVPLTLLRMPLATEIGIIEMGANHIGEIAFLCGLAEPNYGLITNIGKAHLEGFGSYEGVKKAKSELYRYLEKNGAPSFINAEDEVLMSLKPKEIILYPECKGFVEAGFVGLDLAQTKIYSNLVGKYNVDNIRAAVRVGSYFELDVEEIGKGISSYIPDNNRSQLIKTKSNEITLDAYNANPSSMECSIEDFTSSSNYDKTSILIIGSMKELGVYSKAAHHSLLESLAKLSEGYKIYVIGEEFEKSKGDFLDINWYPNTDELIKHLENSEINNARILIKGSRSNRLERVLAYLQE